jgi:hypothetical protein
MSQAEEKAERVRVLQQDASARTGSTFLDHAAPDPVGGRFAHLAPPTVINGATKYPKLPSGPWRSDPVPDEPPLGIDINSLEGG